MVLTRSSNTSMTQLASALTQLPGTQHASPWSWHTSTQSPLPAAPAFEVSPPAPPTLAVGLAPAPALEPPWPASLGGLPVPALGVSAPPALAPGVLAPLVPALVGEAPPVAPCGCEEALPPQEPSPLLDNMTVGQSHTRACC